MFGNVIWVLVVVCFWLTVGTIVFTLVRFVSHENDDEQTVCDLGGDYFNDHAMST